MTHELKILPRYFWGVYLEYQNFVITEDNKDYKIGDNLRLRECLYFRYTGTECNRVISYIYRNCEDCGLKNGFVILGFE